MTMTAEGLTAQEGKDGLHQAKAYALNLMEGPEPAYKGPLARVTFSIALTIPTGQYQNARPMVSMEIPCHPSKVHEAYEFAQNWCDEKLTEMRQAIEASVGG